MSLQANQQVPSGYSVVPWASLPSSFQLVSVATGKYWGYQINGSGVPVTLDTTNPILNMFVDQYPAASTIYPYGNAALTSSAATGWMRINLVGQPGGIYSLRHSGFDCFLQTYTSGIYDFSWRFYYQTGGSPYQVIIGNNYPGDGIGYYISDSGNGRVRINTPAGNGTSGASVFNIIYTPSPPALITPSLTLPLNVSTSAYPITIQQTSSNIPSSGLISWSTSNSTYSNNINPQYVMSYPFTFTNMGASGASGPSTITYGTSTPGYGTAYSLSLSGGIQQWIVPFTGQYTFTVAGAGLNFTNLTQSSPYNINYTSYGAVITATISLTAGHLIKILIGQQGTQGQTGLFARGGGCGGSFVYNATTSTLLFAAGGGGGHGGDPGSATIGGGTSTNPYTNGTGKGDNGQIATSGSVGRNGSGGSAGTSGGGGGAHTQGYGGD
jgi:hypothetical protein